MIHRFERILVPIDFSEYSLIALDHAVYIAKAVNSEITLLHVHETPGFSSTLKNILFKSSSDQKELDKSVEQKLQEIAAETMKKVPRVKTMTRSGEAKIYKQITDVATELQAGLIIMGGRGTRGDKNSGGGANAFRVVASAPCPTITVNKQSGNKGIRDIVLPIDTSRETREKVDDAIYVAKMFNSTIHIAAVTASDDEIVYNHLRKVASQVQHYIEGDKLICSNHFYAKKNITASTLEHAKEIDADLIIIMTEQEQSSGLFMGPYAQQMINQSDIPVMSVRPKERETEFVRPY